MKFYGYKDYNHAYPELAFASANNSHRNLWETGGVECFASEYSEIDFFEFEGEWWGLD